MTSAPGLLRDPCPLEILHLADELAAGRSDEPGVRRGVPERKHDGRRAVLESKLDQAAIHRPGDESDAPGTARFLLGDEQLLAQPVRIPVTCAHQPKAAGIGDRGSKPATRHSTHRRQHDRVLQPEHLRKAGTDQSSASQPPMLTTWESSIACSARRARSGTRGKAAARRFATQAWPRLRNSRRSRQPLMASPLP